MYFVNNTLNQRPSRSFIILHLHKALLNKPKSFTLNPPSSLGLHIYFHFTHAILFSTSLVPHKNFLINFLHTLMTQESIFIERKIEEWLSRQHAFNETKPSPERERFLLPIRESLLNPADNGIPKANSPLVSVYRKTKVHKWNPRCTTMKNCYHPSLYHVIHSNPHNFTLREVNFQFRYEFKTPKDAL